MNLRDRLPSLDSLSLSAGLFLLLGVVLLFVTVVIPEFAFDVPAGSNNQGETKKATVTRILEETRRTGPRGNELFQRLELNVDGEPVIIERVTGELDAQGFDVSAGSRVLINTSEGPGGDVTFIVDLDRGRQLWILALAFAALVILVARWQGAASLIGMAASLLVILRFIIPGIVSGHDPVTISLIGAVVIMLTSLYMSHGVNRKTTTALVGTALALAITAVTTSLAVDFAQLTGLAEEQAAVLNIATSGGINPQGLLLAGMIIGALGVLDDVTVAQASSVYELKAANPLLRAPELFQRAMNIGRDHIASTVNTLFLAYAGASLPLLILFSLQTEPASILVSREFLATEVIRTLVGSIGIVSSVPITTALAAASSRLNLRIP